MEALIAVFGSRLRALREGRGLTQEQLGQAAEVDYKHLGAIERGANVPSFEVIERLARALKVDYYELFLPEKMSRAEPDQSLRVLIREIERHGGPSLKQFLHEVLAAGKKLSESTNDG
jgi:transcriptional regulator with XRE-family HTH domain